MNEKNELPKHVSNAKDYGFDNNQSKEIHKKGHHTNVVQKLQSMIVEKNFHYLC